jgi:hypothetical protein
MLLLRCMANNRCPRIRLTSRSDASKSHHSCFAEWKVSPNAQGDIQKLISVYLQHHQTLRECAEHPPLPPPDPPHHPVQPHSPSPTNPNQSDPVVDHNPPRENLLSQPQWVWGQLTPIPPLMPVRYLLILKKRGIRKQRQGIRNLRGKGRNIIVGKLLLL